MRLGAIARRGKKTPRPRPVIGVVLFAVLLLGSACVTMYGGYCPAELQARYTCAVEDARIADYDEIAYDLVPVVESNQYLIWKDAGKDAGKDAMVLMVTWTNWGGYDELVGTSIRTTRETWVTAVPQLLDFVKNHAAGNADPTLRIEQLLGLPPGSGKNRFVEIWVNPQDLFRPSPDPEITDREAETDFIRSKKYVTVSEDYVRWFTDLAAASYRDNGYPWTRLGYTYDWGNPKSEVGLSEFVIRAGATIEIKAVYRDLDYFK